MAPMTLPFHGMDVGHAFAAVEHHEDAHLRLAGGQHLGEGGHRIQVGDVLADHLRLALAAHLGGLLGVVQDDPVGVQDDGAVEGLFQDLIQQTAPGLEVFRAHFQDHRGRLRQGVGSSVNLASARMHTCHEQLSIFFFIQGSAKNKIKLSH